MAKLKLIPKTVNYPEGLLKEIEEFQVQKHIPNFTQATLYLLRYGLDKINPAYTTNKPAPRKTEAEKLLEKKEAERLAEQMERAEQMEAVKEMNATITDKHGNEDPNGTYFKYTIYSLMPSKQKPRAMAFTHEINPLWMAPEMAGRQYEGGTKEEIDAIIKSGKYREMK